jgi:hypothetical protein
MLTKLGQCVMTRGIANMVEKDIDYARFVNKCMARYVAQDWGSVCQEDWNRNDQAFKNGDERILASYEHPLNKSWHT